MAPVRSWGSLAAAAAAMIIIVRANDHEAIAAEAKDLFGGAAQADRREGSPLHVPAAAADLLSRPERSGSLGGFAGEAAAATSALDEGGQEEEDLDALPMLRLHAAAGRFGRRHAPTLLSHPATARGHHRSWPSGGSSLLQLDHQVQAFSGGEEQRASPASRVAGSLETDPDVVVLRPEDRAQLANERDEEERMEMEESDEATPAPQEEDSGDAVGDYIARMDAGLEVEDHSSSSTGTPRRPGRLFRQERPGVRPAAAAAAFVEDARLSAAEGDGAGRDARDAGSAQTVEHVQDGGHGSTAAAPEGPMIEDDADDGGETSD
eukprot:TRINITY_DN7896_c0_g2_i6.p1 TRINITY_DN7896_c0_g2~~TRINITY_DN7896_c0_g2_i6.p1  ORF type:complete len:321 (-),score=80.25 TRINITY_DN7896_c0_g2_i6:65-1027(-)